MVIFMINMGTFNDTETHAFKKKKRSEAAGTKRMNTMIIKWEAYCRGQHLVIKSNELMDLLTIMCFVFVCTDKKKKKKKKKKAGKHAMFSK